MSGNSHPPHHGDSSYPAVSGSDGSRGPRRAGRALGVLALIVGVSASLGGQARAAQAPVGLGTAASFAVLAGSTVTNTGPSIVSGDLGLSPGTSVTGFPPGTVTGGTIHAADAVAGQAKADLITAYNDAAGRAVSATVTADLGTQTLVAGVYRGSTLALTGTLTLDAQGDPNAVFIFQSDSTLITATSSVVRVINGGSACNVFWQIGSSATLGTGSTMLGTVMALTSITANTNAIVTGRLLARNGATTLDTNNVNRLGCSATPALATSPAASSPTRAASPSRSGSKPNTKPIIKSSTKHSATPSARFSPSPTSRRAPLSGAGVTPAPSPPPTLSNTGANVTPALNTAALLISLGVGLLLMSFRVAVPRYIGRHRKQ
jgi:hypothetical protein